MDLSIPLEGATGGAIVAALWAIAAAVRSRMNGGARRKLTRADLPCAEHAEKMRSLEQTIRLLSDTVSALATHINAQIMANRNTEQANIVIVNEHGERIASLEATSKSVEGGMVRIELKLDQIEHALRRPTP